MGNHFIGNFTKGDRSKITNTTNSNHFENENNETVFCLSQYSFPDTKKNSDSLDEISPTTSIYIFFITEGTSLQDIEMSTSG